MIARVVELILFGLMPFLAGSIVANGRELVDDDPAAEVRSVDTQLARRFGDNRPSRRHVHHAKQVAAVILGHVLG